MINLKAEKFVPPCLKLSRSTVCVSERTKFKQNEGQARILDAGSSMQQPKFLPSLPHILMSAHELKTNEDIWRTHIPG